MNMNRRIPGGLPLVIVSATLGLSCASELFAQEANSNSTVLQEVVVTAEKRSSTVQDTPISITAITGQDIEARGVSDFTTLAQSIPGISMKASGAGQTEFEMRGMTSSGGNSATVGFYLDDTPLSAPAAAQNGKVVIDPNLYDLNRVEVLRGPQGTLYGSGSMGGTIRLITNQPDLQAFDVSGKQMLSDTDAGGFNYGENAMINFPLAEGIAALRLVGTYEHDSGWIDRKVIANGDFPLPNGNTRGDVLAAPVAQDFRGVNDEDVTALRASLLVRPVDWVDITPSFFYQKITQDGLSQIDSNPGILANFQPYNQAEPFTDRFDLGGLNAQVHMGFADLTSQTSYWTRDEELRQDGSEELQFALAGVAPLFGCPTFTFSGACSLGPTTPTPLENDTSWQTSEELRLTSNGTGPFQWLVGYYYSDFESDWDLYVPLPGAAGFFGTGNAFTQLQPTKIIQNSFFGEASYKITPDLKFTVGLRRYRYNNEVNTTVSGFLSSTGGDTIAQSTNSEHDQGLNPKFDLSYDLDKDLLLYATASKGFRPGGANQPIPTSGLPGSLGQQCESGTGPGSVSLQSLYGTTSFVPAPDTFNPDSVWSYELGEKWRSDDGRVTLNGAGYFSQWNDAQQFVGLSCGFNFSTNTGDAHIYGGELELNALVVTGLVFSINGAYTHAQFVESSVLPGVVAANGLQVQDVPKYTWDVALSYAHPLTDGVGFIARAENMYTAGRTEVTNALHTLPPYALTNLRAGVEGDKWSAVLYASNVFNRVAWESYAFQINVGIPTFQRVTVAPPLTVGIDLTYHLGK
jgi:iron complex outermembrane recepter protein